MSTIKINGIEKSISGLLRGEDLYKLGEVPDKDKLFLDIKGEVDIPVNKDDYIVITGGENFTVGQSNIADNPTLRNKISIQLNGENITLTAAKIRGHDIRKKDIALESSKLYADIPNYPDQHIVDQWTLIVRNNECFITIPTTNDDITDIEECAKHNRKPPKKQDKYKIKIDGEKYTVESSHLSGEQILNLAGKESQQFSLQQKYIGGKREPITPKQDVDFSAKGIERFETAPKQAQQG